MPGRPVFLAVASLTSVFFFSGVVFGWAAINSILIDEGYYRYLCDDQGSNTACDAQIAALNQAFTIASTAVSLVALPAGYFCDKFGPTWAAIVSATLNVMGLVGIALSNTTFHGSDFDCFLVSLVLISVGGSLTMFNGYQVPFLFPEHSTLIIEINSCLFDASTIVFPVFKILYDAGVPFTALFWSYTVLACINFFVLTVLWSFSKAKLDAVKQAVGDDTADGTSGGTLASKPLGQQVRTLEFFCILVYSLVQVPRSNLYMGSVDLVNTQIAQQRGQMDHLATTTSVIGLVIPFGFLSVPAIEFCIHRAGLISTLQITTLIGVVYNLMQLVPDLYFQLATVVVFAAWRAFLFSIISAFNAGFFGPRTMGRVMGIGFLFSGMANLAQSPVINYSLTTLGGNFRPMLVGALAVVVPLPFFVAAVKLKQRREHVEAPLIERLDGCHDTMSYTLSNSEALSRKRTLSHGTAAGASAQITAMLAMDSYRSQRTSSSHGETSLHNVS